ncbi:tripartite motif-containing protein 45-like isoform X2 [Ostrea edulis]|nr:tripartite motif-containing protein 45-like isoform X2 [Ostrea edulis]
MATASSFAQHYIECENCEENPAKFLCKTCPGHLCVSCKSEHERRKITQNHDIIHLASEKGDMMELLYCSEHRTKKLECYCSPCQKPVCTRCIIETHNGHKVETLATVYNRIKKEQQIEKEEIEKTLLPKYEELLAKEKLMKAEISKRTDEVQKQIEDHTEKVIERYTAMKEKKIRDLRQAEQTTLKSVEDSEMKVQRRIELLKKIKTQITNNLGARPGIIFFNATHGNSLKEMRQYPNSIEYKLDNFSSGDIERITLDVDFWKILKFTMVDSSASRNPDWSLEEDEEEAEEYLYEEF